MRKNIIIQVCAAIVLVACCTILGCISNPVSKKGLIAFSADGTPISYSVYGKGDVSLVFIHGWCCDSRYWQRQINYFAKKYKVVTLDLAGHGHSGNIRKVYTIEAFGQDVKSVADKEHLEKVVLIGHSMGGEVAASAAGLLADKAVGLIGVDTLQNVEQKVTREQADKILNGLKSDFRPFAARFIKGMFRDDAPSEIVDWVINDMTAADPEAAVSMTTEYFKLFVGNTVKDLFKGLDIPVRAIDSDMTPIDYEANRKHMKSFNAIIMPNTGHFLMMVRYDEFNQNLADTIQWILNSE